MRTTELIQAIEAAAPPGHQAGWDASGLQIAGEADEVRHLAVALDPTPDFVQAALAWGAEVLLTHHPLTLSPRLPNRADGFRDVLKGVLASGAWLYAAHTSLDVQSAGPVAWLAEALGLTGVATLDPLPGQTPVPGARALGYGFVGDLPRAMAPRAFLAALSGMLPRGFFTASGPEPARVGRVACLPGSGASLAGAAFAAGADVFLTGDVKHHQALESAGWLVDVGHFILEEEMMRRFADALAGSLAAGGVEVRFFPGGDPIRLLPPVSATAC